MISRQFSIYYSENSRLSLAWPICYLSLIIYYLLSIIYYLLSITYARRYFDYLLSTLSIYLFICEEIFIYFEMNSD